MFDDVPTVGDTQPKRVEDIFADTEHTLGQRGAPPVAPAPPAETGSIPVSVAPLTSEPKRSRRGLVIGLVVAVLVLGLVAAAYWWFTQQPTEVPEPVTPPVEQAPAPTPEIEPTPPLPPPATETPSPVDTDSDGLPDDEEAALGTNPQNIDSDSDGLFDRDEVRVYQTDPLNPDSDGDTFSDGTEVQNGYNPKGQGKLLELPQS